LLLGKTGQLGCELQRALIALGEIVALDRAALDLMQPQAIRATIDEVQPRLIVNAAAYTAVDRAESERDTAALINAEAPRTLAEAAQALDIPLLHYSTDYVFSGDKPTPYVEADPTAPQSWYGATKLEGERAIHASGARGVIFRTSWVFGETGGNFVRTILRLAAEKETLRVVADQVGAPTPARLIADVTADVIRTFDGEGWPRATVYHLAAAGAVSWHAFAQTIVAKALERGMPLALRPENIEAIPTSDHPTPAARPKNSRLDCSALARRLGIELPGWEPYLDRMLARYTARA
jgi:dTDP-4-dehydrorhamnose reductase